MEKIYLESSFIGYLVSQPSRDVVTAGHQQVTREWWERCRTRFELYVSTVVVDEISLGHPEEAQKRLRAVEGLRILNATADARRIARRLITEGPLPPKAIADAAHIGIAVAHGVDYLLTWNCTHIANAAMHRKIRSICRSERYEMPVICTPEELMTE